METRSNFGSQKFGTTKIRNDNEDSYVSINLPLTLSSFLRAETLEASFFSEEGAAVSTFGCSCESIDLIAQITKVIPAD